MMEKKDLIRRMNKKGNPFHLIVIGIVSTILAFLVILYIFQLTAQNFDIEAGMAVCRASVIMSEKLTFNIDANKGLFGNPSGGDVEFKPLKPLCRTYEIEMPELKDYRAYTLDKEGVMRNIAERTADCWRQFAEGTIDKNVFGEHFGWTGHDAFACFTFTIDDDYKITPEDVMRYMEANAYKARSSDKVDCSDLKDNNLPNIDKADCVKEDDPECVRKGGVCARACESGKESEYSYWGCSSNKEKCCVKNDDLISYAEYVARYGGDGLIFFEKGLSEFNDKDEYAIYFIVEAESGLFDESITKPVNWVLDIFRKDRPSVPSIYIGKSDSLPEYMNVHYGVDGE